MHTALWWKPHQKRPQEIPGGRWENDIKIDIREIEWGDRDDMYLAQNVNQWRDVVDSVINFWFHRMLEHSWIPKRLATYQKGSTSKGSDTWLVNWSVGRQDGELVSPSVIHSVSQSIS
jgi:hypothetical protein